MTNSIELDFSTVSNPHYVIDLDSAGSESTSTTNPPQEVFNETITEVSDFVTTAIPVAFAAGALTLAVLTFRSGRSGRI